MGRHGDSNVVKRKDNRRDQVSHTTKLDDANADHTDSHSSLWFESRENLFNEIMESFQDDSIPCVGLYGIGGSGKTTFAKQLGKRAMELNMFNLVVFVRVGFQFFGVKRIQAGIAKQLGVMIEGEDDSNLIGRQIWINIERRAPVLVILDDIWKQVNLEEIGISNGHNRMGCKLLITSRNQNIGPSIGVERRYSLYLLTNSEAFDLLRKHAGLVDGSPNDITEIAMEVAEWCKGLPIVISLVGSTLRGKGIDHWKQVLTIGNDVDRYHDGYHSYCWTSYLSNFIGALSIAAKTLFLICGLIPLGEEIAVEDLSLYAVRLGLCSGSEAIAAINSLKKFSLLMQSDESSDLIIMHDLHHDMAQMLVHQENHDYQDSIREYMTEFYEDEEFQWKEELEVLLIQLFGVTEYNPSSSSFSGDPGLQIVPSNSYIASSRAATIPKPSGKMVNFKEGRCMVDKSFLPLLKEACKANPQLLESQRMHSEFLKQNAFDSLGKLLFLLRNVRNKDWVHHKQELQMFWDQTLAMKFKLDWLRPTFELIFSSPEFARIEALREEERCWNEEAAKLRERLKVAENKAAVIRTEIERQESMLNGFAIAHVSKAQVVPKANTRSWWKIFSRK